MPIVLRMAVGILISALIGRPLRHWLIRLLTADPLKREIEELRELVIATMASAHRIKHTRPDLFARYAIAWLLSHHEGDLAELADDLRQSIGETVQQVNAGQDSQTSSSVPSGALTGLTDYDAAHTALSLCRLLEGTAGGGEGPCRVDLDSGEDVGQLLADLAGDPWLAPLLRPRAFRALRAITSARLAAVPDSESPHAFVKRILADVSDSLHVILELDTSPPPRPPGFNYYFITGSSSHSRRMR